MNSARLGWLQILGHESYHASHTFWNFIVNGFIDHQHKLHKQPDAEDETDSSSDDASVISDWEDAEDDTIDALSKRGLDDEGQGMVSKDKMTIYFRNQLTDYLHRGDDLQDISPYEYSDVSNRHEASHRRSETAEGTGGTQIKQIP